MDEGKKTGVFWAVAAVVLGLGAFASYQPSSDEAERNRDIINTALFGKFKDPLAAASLKVTTFDEEQGSLETFEVRKDRGTGAWTIPSRDGYPADAVEQMQNAANSLVDLRILDTIYAEPGDHADFGVVEPNLEDLNVGDVGVGRLVTFKDSEQKTLASVIIGDPVKDQEGQLYVRKPNQDPVYVVALDDKPLTTKFQDWIEEDLLKLSSLDIKEIRAKDYNATLNPLNGSIALVRNYDVDLSLDGTTWKVDALREYDPKNAFADPKTVEVGEDDKLNTTKLNDIKNALDDVKINNVVRKPEGMSANLKADQKLAADTKAMQSLASHGFYPVPLKPDAEPEIISANGELVVGLNDGVEYVLRFGNISGLSDEEDEDDTAGTESTSGGVNRYLLVTTRVNVDKFPAPDLKPIPQSIDEIEGYGKKDEPEATEKPAANDGEGDAKTGDEKADDAKTDDAKTDDAKTDDAKTDDAKTDDAKTDDAKTDDAKTDDEKAGDEKADDDKRAEPAESQGEDAGKDSADEDAGETTEADDSTADSSTQDSAESSESSDEIEVNGSGEASGAGQGQDPQQAEESDTPEDSSSESNPAADQQSAEKAATESEGDQPKDDPAKSEAETEPKAADKGAAKPAADAEAKQPATAENEKVADDEQMTDEEKEELLEAEQEKTRKENQRKIDEREDKLEAARKKVRDLNARFADWYYVVPEETYSKLRIKRDDLFEKKPEPGDDPAAGPSLDGLPGITPPTGLNPPGN